MTPLTPDQHVYTDHGRGFLPCIVISVVPAGAAAQLLAGALGRVWVRLPDGREVCRPRRVIRTPSEMESPVTAYRAQHRARPDPKPPRRYKTDRCSPRGEGRGVNCPPLPEVACDPARATHHLPGTLERMAVYALRAELRLPLFHPRDEVTCD